jgi:NAD(P)-dependent dehydrogenase (short-subunit alcohol dehydrogenase family)
LEDHVALVTGGGGDIGRAIARRLAGLGAHLCIVGRRRQPLETTAEGLSGVVVCPVDLTSADGVDALIRESERRFGARVDVLVHCAGIYRRAPLEEARLEDLDEQFTANVRAPYRLTQALLPMLERSQGQIVFINSTQGLIAGATLGQYAATQHALRAVADSLRAEVNERGVRVLTLHLGRTATERQERVFLTEGRPYRPELLLQPDDVAMVVASCLTLPRTAEVTSLNIRPMIKSY